MLKSIIRTLLQKFIDDIDSDNCNITMEQQSKIISVLSNIANPDQRMSKIQACDYLIETHQSIIKGCDEILQQLNPEIIEKQRQEQENKALREEINSLKEMFKEFINTSLKQEKHGNNN